jgi:hypothetical protein
MQSKDDQIEKRSNRTQPSNRQNRNIIHFIQDLILYNAKANSPDNWRDSFKLIIAAALSFGLWFMLGSIAIIHIESSREFARKIADLPTKDTEKVAQIEKAALGFESTVKTLYALVTPLATAVTGYFFAASAINRERKEFTSQAETLEEKKQEEA